MAGPASTLAAPLAPPADHQAAWRLAGLVWLALLALILWLYRDTGRAMVEIWWRSETFTHAFLVPPISAWLAWRRRQELAALTPRPLPWLALALAAVALVWWAADLVVVNVVTQAALVTLIVLSVPAVFGWAVTRRLLFPLGFLFFAVPAGDFLTPYMMGYTADFTVTALRLSGIPVEREGLQFVIPSGRWSVVEACSGVRYLMASLMVGALFAYMNYRSLRKRALFMLVAIAMPVVANWVRAYLIVMLGHLSGNELATGADHLIYGWVFFGMVIMAMFWVGMRWADPDVPAATAAVGTASAAAAPTPRRAQWAVAALALAAAVAMPAVLSRTLIAPPQGGLVNLRLPDALAGAWAAVPEPAPLWSPTYPQASAQTRRAYRHDGRTIGLHIAYFRQQGGERKLVSSSNQIVSSDDDFFHALRSVPEAFELPPAASLTLHGVEMAPRQQMGSAERLYAWRVYWVNGRWEASNMRAKLAGAWQRLAGRHGDDGAVLIVNTVAISPEQAAQTVQAFLRENAAPLARLLEVTAGG